MIPKLVISLWALAVLSLSAHAKPPAGPWPALPLQSSGAPTGARDAALIVGIEQYADLPAIPGAVANAEDWYAYLVRVRGVPASNVVILRNKEATQERILRHSAAAAGLVRPKGTLWVVFIGHGAPAPDGRGGMLVGYDAQQEADSLFARSVTQEGLEKIVTSESGSRTVLVIDACFSGRAGDGRTLVPGLQPVLAVRAPKSRVSGTITLTAGRASEFAGPLPGAGRPAFSYLLLGALLGWGDGNADGDISAAEATSWVRGTLRSVVRGRTQTPQLNGPQSLVLATRAHAKPPDVAEIVLSRPSKIPQGHGLTLTAYLMCQKRAGPSLYEDLPDCQAAGLRPGDRMKIGFEVSQKARVYVFNHNATGQFQTLFPESGIDNEVEAGTRRFLPPGDKWFVADDVRGTVEHLHVIAAHEKMPGLEALLGLEVAPRDRVGTTAATKRLRSAVRTRGFNKPSSRPVVLQTASGPVATLPIVASTPGVSAVELRVTRH